MGERGTAGGIGGTHERTAEAPGKAVRRPMRGRVDYIHPRGRFHIVAFKVRGKIIKETFQGVEV